MRTYINDKKVAILMATYNGEQYIKPQLESILNQNYNDWTLYIHDDGSSDGTCNIIRNFSKEPKHRIIFIEDGIKGLGPKDNFMHLLYCVNSEIYMFADQDDIWYKEKTRLSVNKLASLSSNKAIPLLVYTDFKLGNKKAEVIFDSFWECINHNPNEQHTLKDMAYSNYMTGCTMCFNKATKEKAFPIETWAPMHDWWIGATVYSNQGIVANISTPTMIYRKHGNNATGDFVRDQIGKNIYVRIKEMLQQYLLMKKVGAVHSIFEYFSYKRNRRNKKY